MAVVGEERLDARYILRRVDVVIGFAVFEGDGIDGFDANGVEAAALVYQVTDAEQVDRPGERECDDAGNGCNFEYASH